MPRPRGSERSEPRPQSGRGYEFHVDHCYCVHVLKCLGQCSGRKGPWPPLPACPWGVCVPPRPLRTVLAPVGGQRCPDVTTWTEGTLHVLHLLPCAQGPEARRGHIWDTGCPPFTTSNCSPPGAEHKSATFPEFLYARGRAAKPPHPVPVSTRQLYPEGRTATEGHPRQRRWRDVGTWAGGVAAAPAASTGLGLVPGPRRPPLPRRRREDPSMGTHCKPVSCLTPALPPSRSPSVPRLRPAEPELRGWGRAWSPPL